jgi:hypothetical protein
VAWRICEGTEWKDADIVQALAAAQRFNRRFDDAVATQRKALSLLEQGSTRWNRARDTLRTYGADAAEKPR